MGDYGFRISQDGVDVKTGTDKEMVVTSKYANLKGALSGIGTISFPENSETTVSVAHNLGYIPMVRALVSFDDVTYFNVPYFFATGSVDFGISCYADINNLYFYAYHYMEGGRTLNWKYKYFIFLDKGKL